MLAANLINEATMIDAVWRNGIEAQVVIDLGEPMEGAACFSHSVTGGEAAPSSDWALHIPLAGRLRSTDARIDMPLDRLVVSFDDDSSIPGATLRAIVPTADLGYDQKHTLGDNVDQLDAWVMYDFAEESTRVDGIIYLQEEERPGLHRWTDCVAFPPGGKWDTGECRYGP
jgi:hypothetical protein